MAHLYEPSTQKLKKYPHRKVCDTDDGDNTAFEVMKPREKVGVSVQKRDEKEQIVIDKKQMM